MEQETLQPGRSIFDIIYKSSGQMLKLGLDFDIQPIKKSYVSCPELKKFHILVLIFITHLGFVNKKKICMQQVNMNFRAKLF